MGIGGGVKADGWYGGQPYNFLPVVYTIEVHKFNVKHFAVSAALYVIFIHSVTNTNSAHSGTVTRYCLLPIFIEMFYPRTTRNS